MSAATSRSPWLTIPIFVGLFFGGGFGGIHLARAIAPESGLAEFVSFLAMPSAFVIGIVGWAGAAIPGALRRLLRLVREREGSTRVDGQRPQPAIPPGSFAFVPVALFAGALSGMVVASVSTSLGFGWVLCLYTVLGLSYGVLCWKLAQTGYLPFPRE